MNERMLDKRTEPDLAQIKEHLGDQSYKILLKLEKDLQMHYQLSKVLRFPFGNSYGWGYKYSHKSTHLCYVFFEKGAFTVTIQIGDKQVHLLEDMLDSLSAKAKELWANRYTCGENGGWIHFRVNDDNDLNDICKLIKIRKKPSFTKIMLENDDLL